MAYFIAERVKVSSHIFQAKMNKGVALVVLLMVTMTMASTLRKRFNLNKYPELYERNDEVITESINIFHQHCVKAYREVAIPPLIFIDDKAVCKDESISQGRS